MTTVPVTRGDSVRKIGLSPSRSVTVFLPTDVSENDITYNTRLYDEWTSAPVGIGEELGTLKVMYKGEAVADLPLVAAESADEALYSRLMRQWGVNDDLLVMIQKDFGISGDESASAAANIILFMLFSVPLILKKRTKTRKKSIQ